MTIDLDRYRIVPGETPRLDERDTADTQGLSEDQDEDRVDDQVEDNLDRIDDLQERLYAESEQSLLIVLQAMDGAGKDSTIRSVFGPLNPQGVRVASFKAPTKEELAHDFLWRVHRQAPEAGHIRIFNRSHYEDVLVVRVHEWADAETIERRYDHINHFEALLADRGTCILKLMLHVSPEYQLERMRRRLRKPDKHWKFNPEDLEERKLWDDYQDAFEVALARCSTEAAPWYVIPAEERWFRDLVVSQLVLETLEDMDPQYPEPSFDPADFPPDEIS
ncbi:MAG: polyphosphate kinase 2 family protein [Bacteroidota bacterium]